MVFANDGWFAKNIVKNHFHYLYFQMAVLTLMQRASILRFSNEATRMVSVLNNPNLKAQRAVKIFYKKYLAFINNIYFREISPQEQGIELYAMLREAMQIDTNANDLKSEITELNNYALMIESSKQSREATWLNWIATLFLPSSFLAAIFGFSNFSNGDEHFIDFIPSLWITIAVFFIVLFVLLFIKYYQIKRK